MLIVLSSWKSGAELREDTPKLKTVGDAVSYIVNNT
jgi:hypothetical protein